jgi:N-acetylglucosamine-6-phosphate deacetylase
LDASGDAKTAIVALRDGAPATPRTATRLGVRAALVGGRLVPGDVEVLDGRVAAYGLPAGNGRGIASPGFVDLQVNGFGGVDFLDADSAGYRQAGEALLETGVTAYLPTLITAPEERLVAALREIADDGRGPRILGAHVEGPFLSPRRLGAHPPPARRDPDVGLLERLLSAGPVRLYTLAPELPGALELVDLLVARGVTVSAGHTDATGEEANAAFDRGVRTVTHLFNAMRPFSHRDPGVAGVALARPDVIVQIIIDGAHLAPDTARLVWRASAGRLALVTDAVAAAGVSGNGSFRLGDVAVEAIDGVVRRDDGVLAGSALTMIEAVRNLHALGVPLEAALDAATAVPARVIEADAGRIEVGAPADIVVLSDELEIERVLVGGEARVAA